MSQFENPEPMYSETKEEWICRRAACGVALIKSRFGEPQLLDEEDPQAYDRILLDLVRTLHPSDVIQYMLVRNIADAIWWDIRYDRFSRDVLNRAFRARKPKKQRLLQHTNGACSDGQALDQTPPSLPIGSDADESQVEARENANAEAVLEAIPTLEKIEDLRARKSYGRNVALQLRKEYRTGGDGSAYLQRKEHQEQAKRVIAERDAMYDRMLDQKKHQKQAAADEKASPDPVGGLEQTTSPVYPTVAAFEQSNGIDQSEPRVPRLDMPDRATTASTALDRDAAA
jgi:hypothetical protein